MELEIGFFIVNKKVNRAETSKVTLRLKLSKDRSGNFDQFSM